MMELMDVTIRESVYYGSGIDYEEGLEYLQKLSQFISPDEVKYVEICYINTNESGHLNYNPEYIKKAHKIVNGQYELVGMMHPGSVDIAKWDKSVISLFSIVRIVCGGDYIPENVKDFISYLHSVDVKVSINISFALKKSFEDNDRLCKECVALGADYVYFADSSGSAYSTDIDSLCDILVNRQKNNKIGFHLHDHMGLSFSNAIEIFKRNVDITDVSITGAGRGGGNLKTELMVPYIKKMENKPISEDLFCRLLEYIEYFNVLVRRESSVYKQQFLDTLSGIFKLGLKQQETIEKKANGNGYKYIKYVFEEQK